MSNDTKDRFTVYIDPALKRRVKVAAAQDGKTVTQWVAELFSGALAERPA